MDAGVETGPCRSGPTTSLGDTAACYLLRRRDPAGAVPPPRIGQGQFLDTSILYAHLLNTSLAWVPTDGTPGNRPVLDEMQTGWSDRYRLHETADKVRGARHRPARRRLRAPHGRRPLRPDRGNGSRCSTAAVPCEVADADFVLSLFDDPEMIEKGWVRSYEQPLVGRMDRRRCCSTSTTPRCPAGPAARARPGHAADPRAPGLRRGPHREAARRRCS